MIVRYFKCPIPAADIFPLQFGDEHCSPLKGFGPAVRNFYLIHYVYSGCGELVTNTGTYKIHAGQLFLIYPDTCTYYRADESDPWHYSWVEFDGRFCQTFTDAAGFTPDTPVLDDCSGIGSALRSLIDDDNSNFEITMSLFWAFLAALTHGRTISAKNDSTKTHVLNAENFIRSNINKKITVSDIARFLSLDRSHLTRIFKKINGISPKEYIISSKLDLAAQMLNNKDISIKEAAAGVGYNDPLEFSKLFRKKFGVSPSEWRKRMYYEQSVKRYTSM